MSPRPHIPVVISCQHQHQYQHFQSRLVSSLRATCRHSHSTSPAFASDVSASPAPVPHVPSISALVSTLRQ
ncbi:hypothetical protein K456DRAFT_54043, partial [Colletotrichum gloeosporioides 23]